MVLVNTLLLVAVSATQLARGQGGALAPHRTLLRGGDWDMPDPSPRRLKAKAAKWGIEFLNLVGNFSAESDEELVLSYSIGKNRPYEVELLARDCATAVTGIDIVANETRTVESASRDRLRLAYGLNASDLPGSNIFNETLNRIELCQVVNLTVSSSGNRPALVINSDLRRFDLDLDFSAEFVVEGTGLREPTIENETGSINVTGYVESCKCGGAQNFTCDAEPLDPDAPLYVCVWSTSSEVEVDFLDSMVISQDSTVLAVIEGNNVSIPDITTREYVAAQNGVSVSTRVPRNLFDFSPGNSISIAGDVDLKLAGGVSIRRRLHASAHDDDDYTIDEDDMASAYNLVVALRPDAARGAESSSPNSASVASTGLAAFAVALAFFGNL